MTKRELIKQIHDSSNYDYTTINDIVDQVFNNISEAFETDEKIVISGFGTFTKHYQDSYIGVHPQTGKNIKIDGSYKIRFTTSKLVKGKLNK